MHPLAHHHIKIGMVSHRTIAVAGWPASDSSVHRNQASSRGGEHVQNVNNLHRHYIVALNLYRGSSQYKTLCHERADVCACKIKLSACHDSAGPSLRLIYGMCHIYLYLTVFKLLLDGFGFVTTYNQLSRRTAALTCDDNTSLPFFPKPLSMT